MDCTCIIIIIPAVLPHQLPGHEGFTHPLQTALQIGGLGQQLAK
jgi:hypothetical protein